MTICAAVMCGKEQHEFGRDSNKTNETLLGICDRMFTAGDEEIEFETANRTKIFVFTPPNRSGRIVALGSGDCDTHFTIAEMTHQEALRSGISDVHQMARLYSENFTTVRQKRAEQLYLVPQGLTLHSFVAKQRTMQPGEVARISDCLQRECLGLETIIAGVDSSGPHIYSVGGFRQATDGNMLETAEVIGHDGTGYYAVGIGQKQFMNHLSLMGYDCAWPLMDALFVTLLAKRQAEICAGIGPTTDLAVIRCDSGLHYFPREILAKVEGYCQKFEQDVAAQRYKTLKEMKQEVNFVWGPEATAPDASNST